MASRGRSQLLIKPIGKQRWCVFRQWPREALSWRVYDLIVRFQFVFSAAFVVSVMFPFREKYAWGRGFLSAWVWCSLLWLGDWQSAQPEASRQDFASQQVMSQTSIFYLQSLDWTRDTHRVFLFLLTLIIKKMSVMAPGTLAATVNTGQVLPMCRYYYLMKAAHVEESNESWFMRWILKSV